MCTAEGAQEKAGSLFKSAYLKVSVKAAAPDAACSDGDKENPLYKSSVSCSSLAHVQRMTTFGDSMHAATTAHDGVGDGERGSHGCAPVLEDGTPELHVGLKPRCSTSGLAVPDNPMHSGSAQRASYSQRSRAGHATQDSLGLGPGT